jgi:hypothetical protein
MKSLRYLTQDDCTLEKLLGRRFDACKVTTPERIRIMEFLEPLKTKSPATNFQYKHSLRVGIVASDIGRSLYMDQKALLYAGLIHDNGKIDIPDQLLSKTDRWTKADARLMRRHALSGYNRAKGLFPFSAEIMIWHHRFQPNPYPRVRPRISLAHLSEASKAMIPWLGRLLAIADVYDALHRVNMHAENQGVLDGNEIANRLIAYNPDLRDLIIHLYDEGVLTLWTGEPE